MGGTKTEILQNHQLKKIREVMAHGITKKSWNVSWNMREHRNGILHRSLAKGE